MSRKLRICFGIISLLISICSKSQTIGIKTNILYDASTTIAVGTEFRTGGKTTLDVPLGVNLWTFSQNRKLKHLMIQPEIRYWFCEPFMKHFVGLHLHGMQFNVGGMDIPMGRLSKLKDHRYEGYLYGAGVSYGYQWLIHPLWNLELSMGGGYARIHYDKYPCQHCGAKVSEGKYNYFGVTKAAVSLIYFIK
ncbi:DUF3575 domain-containing protein [Proteiniphilum sp. UBA5384]|uniref:DUF3575 domain-containing protein n=1 Tax=Proteiniphilum sp. UBA5384 TaxID=1947279 RepID=UPI0025F02B0B|nr:DUF3575 domain-containing protein [Proteiniphilum sp. UBA5384]